MEARSLIRAALACFFLHAFHIASPAATYYVDAQAGRDTNAGTSPSAAWQTIQAVNSRTYAPGDSILLKRGQTWREQLTVSSSGAVDRPITFGAYGSGANPLIYRTESYTRWAEQSLVWNGGFEDYTVASPNKIDLWDEKSTGSTRLTADPSVRNLGAASLRLTGWGQGRAWGDGQGAAIVQTITLTNGLPYYIRFFGRVSTGAPANLVLQLKDLKAAKYYDGATGAWTSNPTAVAASMAGQTSEQWIERSLVVQTAGVSTTSLSLTFANFASVPCWIDDVYVMQGTQRATARLWVGKSRTGYSKIRGYVLNGQRRPELTTQTMDAVFAVPNQSFVRRGNLAGGYFWYRQDSGVPPAIEVGARSSSVLVRNKTFVTIDGIDGTGLGAGISSGDSERGIIMIDGTSSNVLVRNCKVTNSSGPGLLVGTSARDIHILNVESAFNESTGISVNSRGGTVERCTVHHNGQFLEDKGDRGGIGVTGGSDILIVGNNVYSSGPENGDADPEIAVVGIRGPITITRNYIHDCFHGGILVAEGTVNGVEVSYNVINGYGTSNEQGTFATGRFAGICLGGVNSAISGVRILNNTIVGGRSRPITGSGGITVATAGFPNVTMLNNLFSDNTCPDMMVGSKADITGMVIGNNLYYKPSYTGNWAWKGRFYDTLAAWQRASSRDANALTADPQFVDRAAADFRLKPTSPAIDKGTEAGMTKDFFGNTVPHADRPDIGACEWAPPALPTPEAPTDEGQVSSSTQILFQWEAVTSTETVVAGYELQVWRDLSGTDVTTVSVGNVQSCTVTAAHGQELFARIRARDAGANRSAWSEYSDGISVDVLGPGLDSAAPHGLQAVDVSFDEAVRYADRPANYSCSNNLAIMRIAPISSSEYRFFTTPHAGSTSYTITARDSIRDFAGNPLDPARRSVAFQSAVTLGVSNFRLYR